MEQAGHRSRQAAAEQSHSGAARARLDFQDHHVGCGMAGRHRAGPARELHRRRRVLRPPLRLLGERRATARSISRKRSTSPATFSSTRWRKNWASTASRNMPPISGLGRKTGIDLPNEVSGVMPSEEWKIRNFKQKWFAGETISVGIGQGAVAITPVQLLRAISAISMGGRMVVPHVINPTELPPGYVEAQHYTEVKNVPDRSQWLEHYHRRDVARSAAGGHRPFGAHSRHRYRGKDRIGADRLAGHPRQASRTAKTCAERMVRGIHPAAQSRHRGLRAVSRRRARQVGGAVWRRR